MRTGANFTLRHGNVNEDDWVIIDRKGNTILELNRFDMWEIEDRFNRTRENLRNVSFGDRK